MITRFATEGIFSTATSVNSFGVKYRMSNTNWDKMVGTTLSTATPATYLQGALGNVGALTTRTFSFSLQHIAPSGGLSGGYIWSVNSIDAGASISNQQAWGTFAVPPSGQVAATLQTSTTDTTQIAPNTFGFNTMRIEARGFNSGASTGTMAFSNLSFSSTTLGTVQGSFDAATAGATVTQPSGYFGQAAPGAGEWYQWLHTDMDFTQQNWTLTGTIQGTKNYTGGDENVRFQISGYQATFLGVAPEPKTLVLVAIGCGFLARVTRRRTT